jgi:hypothetical protein
MDLAQIQKFGDVQSSVGEELDEASVWEYEVWKGKEGGQEHSSSKSPQYPHASEEEDIQQQHGEDEGFGAVSLGDKKRQSFVLQEASSEKEDSSKSTHTTNMKVKSTTEYIPIKQSRIESSSEYSGYSKTFAINNNNNALSPFDQNLPTNIMGTSAPINIPVSAHNQFYKKRGKGEMDSPKRSTLSTDFVPPHLIGTEDEDPELSTSIIKRDQLKRRNTILQQTGFLDSDK